MNHVARWRTKTEVINGNVAIDHARFTVHDHDKSKNK